MTRRQKKRMVKFAGVILGVFCIGTMIGTLFVHVQNKTKESLQTAVTEEENISQIQVDTIKEEHYTDKVHAEKPEEIVQAEKPEGQEENLPSDWNLILVNKNHMIPDDYEVELVEIGDGHLVDARIYEDFRAMIQAAKADGIYLYVTSAYRDMDKQIELHEKKVESYVMEGYSYAEARELAAQVVAIPGTSEHHLGLALDFVSSEYKKLDEGQEETRSFQWLKEHCAEFGFILRYPVEKTDITGIIYEPWHFRYVGKEVAKEIMEAGLTLEEYLGATPVCQK